MPTDDEILERVQLKATAIRRRQRMLVAGAATAIVVALLGGTLVAGSAGDRRDPVETENPAERPTIASTTDPDPGAGGGCEGSPPASTDGSGTETSSPATTSDPLLAQGDPAGTPPAGSSIPPDDLPAASASVVEASSTSCPLQVRVAATHRPGATDVELAVAVTAEARYDAHGFVVWDAADPVQVDLGALERDRGSCEGADGDDAEPRQGRFTAAHTYPVAGAKEVTVTFWAQRCGGPVHEVEVSVVVPL